MRASTRGSNRNVENSWGAAVVEGVGVGMLAMYRQVGLVGVRGAGARRASVERHE